MRSPPKIKTYSTLSGNEIEICIVPPTQFVTKHQHQLLPNWDVLISYLILVLQRSSVSLKNPITKVNPEKNQLRARFMRFGCSLIFALHDLGAESDLFDPRSGYALLANSDQVLDDNAIVKATLGYQVVSYQQCSLLTHPVWEYKVYPSTIATSASLRVIDFCIDDLTSSLNWQPKL